MRRVMSLLRLRGGGHLRLRGVKKLRKLRDVHAIFPVVVVGVAVGPTHAVDWPEIPGGVIFDAPVRHAGQVGTDKALEALFAGVGGHLTSTSSRKGFITRRPS